MKQFNFMITGAMLLALFSCSKGGQLVLEKYVEEQNKALPYSLDEDMSYDSIRCDNNEKIVTQYFSLEGEEGDMSIESIRNQDEEACKRGLLIEYQKDPDLQSFLNILELSDYSLRLVYTTQSGKPIKTLTWNREEYSKKIDAEEIKEIQKRQITDQVNSLKATCPSEIDESTTLKDVSLDWDINEMTFLYDYKQEDTTMSKDSLYSLFKQGAMQVDLEDFKALDLTTKFKYIVKEDTLVITITPDE